MSEPMWLDGDHAALCMGCSECDEDIEEYEDDPDRLHDEMYED